MTSPNPAHSLGAIQRDIAKHLRTQEPLSTRDAAQWAVGRDHGYAAMALIRLAERGVAQETIEGSFLYIRGPLWPDAAAHYKWDVDTIEEVAVPDETQERTD